MTPSFYYVFEISLSCNINIPSFIGNLWWVHLLGIHLNQIPSLPDRERRQMPGVCRGGGMFKLRFDRYIMRKLDTIIRVHMLLCESSMLLFVSICCYAKARCHYSCPYAVIGKLDVIIRVYMLLCESSMPLFVSVCCYTKPRCYSPLWKRVIAWGRSCAASAHGIIWVDAGQNKQGGI